MSQRTLSGDELDDERQRPSTLLFCPQCDEWILRSRRYDHDHELYDDTTEAFDYDVPDTVEPDTEIDIETNERVGAEYEIELSYNVEFRFNILAATDSRAKEIAEEMVDYPSNCADAFQVHSRTTTRREIYADDDGIPDDWDPYGSTPLNDVYGDTNDD